MSKQRNGKYNARKTETDGIKFASALEGKYYLHLKKLQETGEVTRFDMQPSFVLQGGFIDAYGMKHEPIKYVGDFLVYYKDKPPVVIDVKGMTTSVFAIKRKLYCNMFPLELVVLGYSKVDGGFVPMEVIKEGRKARKKEKEKLDKEILRHLLEVNPSIAETAKHFGVTKSRVTKLTNKEAKLNG